MYIDTVWIDISACNYIYYEGIEWANRGVNMIPAANLEGKLSLNWRLDFPNGFLKDDFILALFCRSLSWKIWSIQSRCYLLLQKYLSTLTEGQT